MKNLKLIVAVSGLTLVLGACAKHAIPNYYDDNGNKIAFADYKISKECEAPLGFNVRREVKVTHDKYENSQSYRVHTAYVGDKVSDMSAVAAKQGANSDEIAAAIKDAQNIQAGENYALLYPSDRSVHDTTKSIDNLDVDQRCGSRTAQYSGPGTTSHITGAIKNVSTTTFEVDGTDDTTGQSVDVVISRLLPDPTVPVKGAKLPALLAKNEDDNGRYTIKIQLTKRATTTGKKVVVGQRVVTFLQTVVDDVTTKTTIETEVAAEYLNALDPNILKDKKTACDPRNLKSLKDSKKPEGGVLQPLCAAKPSDATIDIAKVSDLIDISTILLSRLNPVPQPTPAAAPAPAPAADPATPAPEEQGPPSPAPKVETPAAPEKPAPPATAPAATEAKVPADAPAAPTAGDAAPAPVAAKNI